MNKYIALILTLFFCFGGATAIQAQSQQTSYQVFELDSLAEIELQLYDKYVIEPWASNKLMTQSTIKLYNGSTGVLQYLLDNDRYKINVDTMGTRLRLVSADSTRKVIKTKKGDCYEVIELTLYIPESFEQKSEGLFARKPEEAKEGDGN